MFFIFLIAWGYGTRQSVGLSVCQFNTGDGASNGHNSETTSSRTTSRGTGMESVAFSDVILLNEMQSCDFKTKSGDNTMFGQSRKDIGGVQNQ